MNTTRILGVDPGTNILGYAVIEVIGNSPGLVSMGIVQMDRKLTHYEKLARIYAQLQELLQLHMPQTLAIEAPFFGKNVNSMLKLGRAQGVVMTVAMAAGMDVHEYAPRRIKQAVTGRGNASKEQVGAMLGQIFPASAKSNHFDATDALATALCHHLTAGSPIPSSKKTTKRSGSWADFVQANPDRVR